MSARFFCSLLLFSGSYAQGATMKQCLDSLADLKVSASARELLSHGGATDAKVLELLYGPIGVPLYPISAGRLAPAKDIEALAIFANSAVRGTALMVESFERKAPYVVLKVIGSRRNWLRFLTTDSRYVFVDTDITDAKVQARIQFAEGLTQAGDLLKLLAETPTRRYVIGPSEPVTIDSSRDTAHKLTVWAESSGLGGMARVETIGPGQISLETFPFLLPVLMPGDPSLRSRDNP